MNAVEYWLMNNPIRSLVQDRYESRLIRKTSKLPAGEDVLEIGCGQGVGRKLIFKYFKPGTYAGIDLDPKMIERAKRKNRDASKEFAVGDATSLPFPNESFGAVFDYGIIHHIPNWKDALKEVNRVLKPGKEFIFEDLSKETWKRGTGRLFKHVLHHPYDEMFTVQEFKQALQEIGFHIEAFEQKNTMGIAFFYGVARKS